MAKRETLADVPLDGAEVAQDALADRLKRLEAVAGGGGMAADALAGAVCPATINVSCSATIRMSGRGASGGKA